MKHNGTLGPVSTTGISNHENSEPLVSIAPNPSHAHSRIRFNTALEGAITITIRDASGRLIYSGKFTDQKSVPLTVGELLNKKLPVSGVYFLSILQDHYNQTVKFILD
jgi:hypothetical protein